MNVILNQDVLAGKWKQARGMAKQWWGKLTDDDLTRINGRIEELIGKVQERYGYTKEQAEQEVARFMNQFKE
ncbi:MAG: CsbD family protein [Chloroflexi bacterium]|nr:CsbD family protein [Chloroflexota bacterium]